jgi:excisionase family DNA binding protein
MARFLTLREAAPRTGLSVETLYRLHREQVLPTCTIGRVVRISECRLDEWIDGALGDVRAKRGRALT